MFIQGNRLPGRWQGRDQFVVLETGFGQGQNFLQTWTAWRQDPERCRHLFYVAIEAHPLTRDDLAKAQRPSSSEVLQLIAKWPVLTPGLHTLDFDSDGGQITLLLGLGSVANLLPSLVMQVDAFFLSGVGSEKVPSTLDEGLLSRLGRLAAPGCTAVSCAQLEAVQTGLSQAGFTVQPSTGLGSPNGWVEAVFEPRHVPSPPAGGHQPSVAAEHRHALIIGAGLAGCVSAWALAREGWQVTVVDQHAQPASEASGNPGGLFHSIVHGEDGVHARAHRAAALSVMALSAPWTMDGRLAGQTCGLLRLDPKTEDVDAQRLIDKLALPADYVQWLTCAQAQTEAGMAVPSGGWLFKQAGWLHPAGLAQVLLEEARACGDQHGKPLRLIMGCAVSRLAKTRGLVDTWEAWSDGDSTPIASAPTLVLTNANQVNALLGTLPPAQAVALPPLTAIRGQITTLDVATSKRLAQPPRIPVAGSGYALTLPDGRLLCGATTQHGDDCAEVRAADHAHNLGQARRLGVFRPLAQESMDLDALAQSDSVWGRTGWRATTPDRLPLVGALPLSADRLTQIGARVRLDQTRMIPRERAATGGLFVLSGLGSRGITWSVLAGRLLTHWVTGTPCPVEAELRDALDPARFVARNHSKNAK